MSDLHDELQTVDGVGPSKADEIVAIVEDETDYQEEEVEQNIRQAWDYHQAGRPGYAGKYIRRAINLLD
jgi:DNA repair protein RadC